MYILEEVRHKKYERRINNLLANSVVLVREAGDNVDRSVQKVLEVRV
jgi:hypothetical protein